MTLNVATNLAQGLVVWTGTTHMQGCTASNCGIFTNFTVDTRLELRITTTAGLPVALLSPTQAGITNPNPNAEVGGVVSVTDALRNFKANVRVLARDQGVGGAFQPAETFYNSFNHPIGQQFRTLFDGAFWYVNRNPIVDFTFTDHHKANTPITFTGTSSDADGRIVSIGWDFNNDGDFHDAEVATAQWSFVAGTHTVKFQATDAEGARRSCPMTSRSRTWTGTATVTSRPRTATTATAASTPASRTSRTTASTRTATASTRSTSTVTATASSVPPTATTATRPSSRV